MANGASDERDAAERPLWSADSQARRLAELSGDDPALKEAPLRRDVRLLGTVLGEVLREQEEPALYASVEEIRRLAIGHREHGGADDEGVRRAEEIVRGLDLGGAYRLAKAFSIYFELTNLAETAHRQRRRRAAQLHAGDPPQPGPSPAPSFASATPESAATRLWPRSPRPR